MENNMHLGAQLFTVRKYMKTDEDFAATMKKVADIGYKYVQVSGTGKIEWETVRDETAKNGLKIILTHNDAMKVRDNVDEVIKYNEFIGCDGIGIGMTKYPETVNGYLQYFEDIAPALKKIKDAGKIFLYHNHHAEFDIKVDGMYMLEKIMEVTDPDVVKFTFDTYWATYAGADPAEIIRRHPDRIYCTHLKDMRHDEKGDPIMTEMLTGEIDFDDVMNACRENGVEWHFIEQDDVYMDEFESLKISHDNVKNKYTFFD